MATFHINIVCENTVGSTNFKVKYRLMGDSIWTSLLVDPSSGTTVTVPLDSPDHVLLDNRIYDFQIQNLNGADNPLSLITQQCGITDVDIVLSPTNASVGYTFPNLSVDIDSYTATIALASAPGDILQTHILTPSNAVSDEFTGLDAATDYILSITPVANQFSDTFAHPFTTASFAQCPDVPVILAYLGNPPS